MVRYGSVEGARTIGTPVGLRCNHRYVSLTFVEDGARTFLSLMLGNPPVKVA
jgi:hypothetical protein